MFDDLYAPIPDIGAYLARIGLDPEDYCRATHPSLPWSPSAYSMPHTKEALDLLIRAHLMHVPFETLDVFDFRRELSLEIPALFDKIVTRRRGGFCFELYGLFFSLLLGLGFPCYPIAQRVMLFGPYTPLNHRSAVVILEDTKERILCDVGFGGPAPVTALYLDTTVPQKSGNFTFQIEPEDAEGHFRLFLLGGSEKHLLFRFSDEPYHIIDFLPLCDYMAKDRASIFHAARVVNLPTEDGSIAIYGDRLRIHRDHRMFEVQLKTDEDLQNACHKYFGIPKEELFGLKLKKE